ncbi:steroid delta-isomerase [Rossellomorea vietnamensis]|uniref:Steroid delta-isomerase n=1 Tax=Rossellomorea vietnamensis TaxID=218284 RepID=A0A5D4MC23_9BACI|nr:MULTISPECIES: nuclear transport factor 2 family protein [Bacillaceae]TYR99499.1 steroid delta-isomerase [Rossellomorea vietnamensis]
MITMAEELAQKQLAAYNAQNLEAFLECYSDDVLVIEFPSNNVMYQGIEGMRERYGKMFQENPDNHAELLSRIIKGNIAIDHEHVTGRANGKESFAVAMYEVIENKINKVWFVV